MQTLSAFGLLPLPEHLSLSSAEVHIWLVPLHNFIPKIAELRNLLAADECQRANQIRFPKDRNQFIIARSLLRIILSRYQQKHPRQIEFSYGVYGKPSLNTEIQFNIAHSEDFAIFAIAHGRQVGIDIEHIRPIEEIDQLIEKFFSANEKAALHKLERNERLETFFQYWTRKEAFLKARGAGLNFPIAELDFSMLSDDAEYQFNDDAGNSSTWSFYNLFPAADYAATLAVEGRDVQVFCWQFDHKDSFTEIDIHKK